MTEEEAKTKPCIAPCPYNVGAAEKQTDSTIIYRCIGSACMAGRWSSGFPLPDDPPEISSRYRGFCGLAGTP